METWKDILVSTYSDDHEDEVHDETAEFEAVDLEPDAPQTTGIVAPKISLAMVLGALFVVLALVSSLTVLAMGAFGSSQSSDAASPLVCGPAPTGEKAKVWEAFQKAYFSGNTSAVVEHLAHTSPLRDQNWSQILPTTASDVCVDVEIEEASTIEATTQVFDAVNNQILEYHQQVKFAQEAGSPRIVIVKDIEAPGGNE